MCPDFVKSGDKYTVGDLIEYFEGIREKWKSHQDDEKKRKATELIDRISRLYTEGRIGKESYVIINPKIIEAYELRK
jgi:hypothetical protein